MPVALKQFITLPSSKDLVRNSVWVMVVPSSDLSGSIETLSVREALVNKRKSLPKSARDDSPITLDLPVSQHGYCSFAALNKTDSAFKRLTLARKLLAEVISMEPARVSLVVALPDAEERRLWAEALLSASLAAAAELPSFKSKPEKKKTLKNIDLYGAPEGADFSRTIAEAEGNALARYLTLLPPNDLTPENYRKRVNKLAAEHGWGKTFYGMEQLRKKKAGAFVAVAQGSPEGDAGMLKLTYKPAKPRKGAKAVALVGKGICYDTGGTNLKPANYMRGMHGDMQGSAVALGTFLALSQMQVDFPVECWLALAINHIGSKAYKPDDVITALNGTTIEVVHTDAEGRMVLADTLAMATASKPALVMDYATLTGACVYSLGDAYSGVFTNRDDWLLTLIENGRASGERVWPFPQDSDYDTALDSDIADIKQCAVKGNADHILAARFLDRFIAHDTPWIHMDLSSGTHDGGLAHIPSEVTGFGIRYSVRLLLEEMQSLGLG